MENLQAERNWITRSEVATILGVTMPTLRKWEKEGLLVTVIHPTLQKPVYKKETVQKFLEL